MALFYRQITLKYRVAAGLSNPQSSTQLGTSPGAALQDEGGWVSMMLSWLSQWKIRGFFGGRIDKYGEIIMFMRKRNGNPNFGAQIVGKSSINLFKLENMLENDPVFGAAQDIYSGNFIYFGKNMPKHR